MELTLEKQTLEDQVKPAAIIKYANALEVRSEEASLSAQETLVEIARRKKLVKEKLDPIREQTHRAWKSVMELINSFTHPLDSADQIIRRKVTGYQQELDRKAREAAVKDEAKRQEEERKRTDELERQAKAAEAKGKIEKAEAIREAKETYVAPIVFTPPPAPKEKGINFKKVWKGTVVDLKALCLAIGEGKASPNMVSVNQSSINAHAKANKDAWPIPGVVFEESTEMAVRS